MLPAVFHQPSDCFVSRLCTHNRASKARKTRRSGAQFRAGEPVTPPCMKTGVMRHDNTPPSVEEVGLQTVEELALEFALVGFALLVVVFTKYPGLMSRRSPTISSGIPSFRFFVARPRLRVCGEREDGTSRRCCSRRLLRTLRVPVGDTPRQRASRDASSRRCCVGRLEGGIAQILFGI